MEFIQLQGKNLIIKNLFNEEHAAELIRSVPMTFSTVTFNNVGVKIMRIILNFLEEVKIAEISIDYDWNGIMTTPQLVCYDKNQWKTLQQLQNWNREWNELFVNCYFCTSLTIKLNCSWMDQQFVQQLLSGAARMPNIHSVAVSLGSKRREVGEVLTAVGKAKFFPSFSHDFKLLQ